MDNQHPINIAEYIDHTILKPFTTEEDVKKVIAEALEHDFYAVCIPPYYLPAGRKLLKESNVKLATVAGFPLGYNLSSNKTEMVMRCADAGADEVDTVINIAAIKSQDYDFLEEELSSIATAASVKGVLLKVILETCYLTNEEIEKACNLCLNYSVPFIKTSTGFGSHGATIEHIKLIKSIVGNQAKIKASGGIKNFEDAMAMIAAGANRIGTSSGVSIVSR
jgi:deoxyribose-phosphate aldolase